MKTGSTTSLAGYNFDKIFKILEKEYPTFEDPFVTHLHNQSETPFKILIATLLSLRTKDEITAKVCSRLFKKADTPEKILSLSDEELEKLIYETGFYRNKAKTLKYVSEYILKNNGGKVPDTLEELLKIKGVGRKTANLVLTRGFDKYGICVDTHVHRISNRLGWVNTKKPDDTEKKLREILPKKYWKVINDYLVAYGRNICTPRNPKCDICNLKKYCKFHKEKKASSK